MNLTSHSVNRCICNSFILRAARRFSISHGTNKHGTDIWQRKKQGKQDTTSKVIIPGSRWRQDVCIAEEIYSPSISAFLSDLVLIATKLLAYTSDLLQSLRHKEGDRSTMRHAGHAKYSLSVEQIKVTGRWIKRIKY